MYPSFEDLDVWKRACQVAVCVYECMRESGDYGLKDQINRAAVSIASNIAEGDERSDKEFSGFLSIARGSSRELRMQACIANRIGAIDDEIRIPITEETKAISRMLYAPAKPRTTTEP